MLFKVERAFFKILDFLILEFMQIIRVFPEIIYHPVSEFDYVDLVGWDCSWDLRCRM